MSITMQHRLTAEDEEKLKELLEKAVSESEKLIRDGSLDIVVASLEADYNVREIEELVQD